MQLTPGCMCAVQLTPGCMCAVHRNVFAPHTHARASLVTMASCTLCTRIPSLVACTLGTDLFFFWTDPCSVNVFFYTMVFYILGGKVCWLTEHFLFFLKFATQFLRPTSNPPAEWPANICTTLPRQHARTHRHTWGRISLLCLNSFSITTIARTTVNRTTYLVRCLTLIPELRKSWKHAATTQSAASPRIFNSMTRMLTCCAHCTALCHHLCGCGTRVWHAGCYYGMVW